MAVNNLNSGKRRNVGYFPFVADSLFSLSASKTSSFGWSSVIYEKDIHGECHSNILCGRWVWTMSRFRPVVHIDSRLRLLETGFSWTLMSKVALPPPASFYLWSKDVAVFAVFPRILLPLVEGCAADGDLPFLRTAISQSRSPQRTLPTGRQSVALQATPAVSGPALIKAKLSAGWKRKQPVAFAASCLSLVCGRRGSDPDFLFYLVTKENLLCRCPR